MRKGSVIELVNAGIEKTLPRGRIELDKGKAMVACGLKVTVPINNTGGAVTLSAAQKLALLALLQLTMTYGRDGHRKPFNAIPGTVARTLARYCLGSEIEGWTDANTGLGRNLPTGATTNVVFWLPLPTGAFHQFRGRTFWGMGRSQAATVELKAKLTSLNIAANLNINGTTTLEVVPYVQPVKGDRWTYIPEWVEFDENDKVARYDSGLPLLVVERSQPLASSNIPDFGLKFDEEVIHDKVPALEANIDYFDNPSLTTSMDVSDVYTPLYVLGPDAHLEDLSTGAVRFEQYTKTLPTAQIGVLHVPVVSADKVDRDIAGAAVYRNKLLRAASSADVLGKQLPARLRFASPFHLLDQDDHEFEQFPGKLGQPGSETVVESVPNSVAKRARAQEEFFRSIGEQKLADKVVEAVALAQPGAVQSARGLGGGRGSVSLERVRGIIREA